MHEPLTLQFEATLDGYVTTGLQPGWIDAVKFTKWEQWVDWANSGGTWPYIVRVENLTGKPKSRILIVEMSSKFKPSQWGW
jgi:hypothetical protein